MTKILVTGASGYLGSEIVRQLCQKGIAVRTTGRRPSASYLPEYHPANLATSENLLDLLDGVTCVIHAAGLAHQFGSAGENREKFFATNVEATRRLGQAAIEQGVQSFVLVSSVSVYGPIQQLAEVSEAVTPHPVGHYAESKYRAEYELQEAAERSAMQIRILRMATIYGANDPGNVGRLIEMIKRNRFVMLGPGDNRKTLIHRNDAAEACIFAAMKSPRSSANVWNVTGDSPTMREVVQEIQQGLNRRAMVSLSPYVIKSLFKTGARIGLGSTRRWCERRAETIVKWMKSDVYDGTRFREDFDWKPRLSFQQGIAEASQEFLNPSRMESMNRAA